MDFADNFGKKLVVSCNCSDLIFFMLEYVSYVPELNPEFRNLMLSGNIINRRKS